MCGLFTGYFSYYRRQIQERIAGVEQQMKSFGVRGSIAIMLILRTLYAMNWYNVSPILFNILNAYGTPFYLSGLILSAFLLIHAFHKEVRRRSQVYFCQDRE